MRLLGLEARRTLGERTRGNQAVLQVRGRGGKEAALQARRRHFRRGGGTSGEEAARTARGEAEEREGVVDGLDEGMHDWDAVGMKSGDTALHAPPLPASDAQPDLHSVLIPFPPSTLKEGGAAAWRGVNAVTDTEQSGAGRSGAAEERSFSATLGQVHMHNMHGESKTPPPFLPWLCSRMSLTPPPPGPGSAWFERGLRDVSCPPRATAGLRSGGGLHGTPATVVVVVGVVPHEGSPPQRGVWV
ncbi:unnamed protein product [Closterium sp. Naga37s-1]|nr:unnamed protein product [Closterium sp. Naga37s-1]